MQAQEDAKAAVEALAQANRMATEQFVSESAQMRFELSETGQNWQELGGNVKSILDAMVATTGESASSIITKFEGMRLEGENWQDLLRRLADEGVINLGKNGCGDEGTGKEGQSGLR